MHFPKKLLKYLLIFSLALLTFFPTVSKAESNTTVFSNVGQPKEITEKVYLQVNKDGKTKQLNKSKVDLIKDSRKLYEKSSAAKTVIEFEDAYALKKGNVVQTPVEKHKNQSTSPSKTITDATESILGMHFTTTYDPNTSSIQTTIEISEIIGEPPVIVLASNNLFKSNSYEGTYSRDFVHEVDWEGPEIYLGQKSTKSHSVNTTQFWISANATVAGWIGSYPKESSGQLDPSLANRIAELYPIYYNSHSQQYMPIPARADMPVVPPEDRTTWDSSTDRNNYIRNYIDRYGDPGWNWSGEYIHIHHVIPLKYGGTNDFMNLFPLPASEHTSVVTPWWSRY